MSQSSTDRDYLLWIIFGIHKDGTVDIHADGNDIATKIIRSETEILIQIQNQMHFEIERLRKESK